MKTIIISIILTSIALNAQGQSVVVNVPMQMEYWEFREGTVEFIKHNEVDAMKILPDAGKVVAKELEFSTGTIEFEVKFNDSPFVGISFRRHGNPEEEWFYLRSHAAGTQSGDAIQYSPIINGITLWNLYPQYQSSASFQKNKWTHVKLVISTNQLEAYINNSEKPDLWIPYLEGTYKTGKIAFNGEAMFANLTIRHGNIGSLPEASAPDLTDNDPRYIRNWHVSMPTSFSFGREVIDADLPDDQTEWTQITAERGGLINLSRTLITEESDNIRPRKIAWLKTTVNSSQNQTRKLSLGFVDEVYVYLNGQILYIDKNYYQTPIMKEPEGRCSIENTTINVPLAEGDNEILIGVGDYFFGWGIIARWDNLDNLVFQ